MGHAEASELLAKARTMERPAKDSTARLAQAEATLYVGEQLERIANMIRDGFWAEKADFTGWAAGPQERS